MLDLRDFELWFVTGSQHLYGEEVLRQVHANSTTIAAALDGSPHVPVRVKFKTVLTTPDAIQDVCEEANASKTCLGLVVWMHTFSPAKMWIAGLKSLRKPFLHLHTQFNRDIPWATIDMDFMNLNQSAHGDREFGYLCTRMRLRRKVVVGHWQDEEVHRELGVWSRAAAAWHDCQGMRIARFGDNMREVAVTEGDKVAAQLELGWSVSGYGIGELVRYVRDVSDAAVEKLIAEYEQKYAVAPELRKGGPARASLIEAAKIESGMRAFLEAGGFKAFTTTFEDLYGMTQLPGLAVQRLMSEGYGFGAEGDWKTAALLRAFKVMGAGLHGGASFIEDYTYHLEPSGMRVLGAHMLEICASVAGTKPSLEIHPLGIGGKSDPVRLVFNVSEGAAINVSLIDMDNRFRLILNDVEVTAPSEPLPKLPVARGLWRPLPDLKTAAAAWILAGGAHHTAFSQALCRRHIVDFAEMAGVELATIGAGTDLEQFKKELRWNEVYYR